MVLGLSPLVVRKVERSTSWFVLMERAVVPASGAYATLAHSWLIPIRKVIMTFILLSADLPIINDADRKLRKKMDQKASADAHVTTCHSIQELCNYDLI